MKLTELLKEWVNVENQGFCESERTLTLIQCVAVRLHSLVLSLREIE
jgi:hypothetical protein